MVVARRLAGRFRWLRLELLLRCLGSVRRLPERLSSYLAVEPAAPDRPLVWRLLPENRARSLSRVRPIAVMPAACCPAEANPDSGFQVVLVEAVPAGWLVTHLVVDRLTARLRTAQTRRMDRLFLRSDWQIPASRDLCFRLQKVGAESSDQPQPVEPAARQASPVLLSDPSTVRTPDRVPREWADWRLLPDRTI